jgi:hypothetical protein
VRDPLQLMMLSKLVEVYTIPREPVPCVKLYIVVEFK